MMSDVPDGVLISGGVDSSLIAAVVSKFAKNRIEDGDNSEAWWPQLHSFAVGLEGAPDLKYAQKVADFIGLSLDINDADYSHLEKELTKLI